jgi:NADH dehydrogenase FAD-containing subunit
MVAWFLRFTKRSRYCRLCDVSTIGRLSAIVDVRGIKFSGATAWFFWLAARVIYGSSNEDSSLP